jgi:ketosteroid isomerase-like protein
MPNTTDQSTLELLNQQYIAAFLNSDVNWYQQHLTDDFVCIDSDATVFDKKAFLDRTARGPDVTDYKLENVRVRIYGDTALVQATGLFTRKDGTPGLSRYTDIYVRTNGEWKAVSAQITRPPTQARASSTAQ